VNLSFGCSPIPADGGAAMGAFGAWSCRILQARLSRRVCQPKRLKWGTLQVGSVGGQVMHSRRQAWIKIAQIVLRRRFR
jgi:hypothetical protein